MTTRDTRLKRTSRSALLMAAAGTSLAAAAGLMLLGGAAGWAIPRPYAPAQVQIDQRRIEQLYTRHCAACHGPEGRGDGPAAALLFPAPRAFDQSPFRFAATGGSKSDVLRALESIIGRGVPRSAMPGFKGALTDDEIRGLAAYVSELTPMDNGGGELPVGLWPPTRPRFDESLIQRGARLYTAMGCTACHGEKGRGDSAELVGLTDSRGDPVWAADLASGQYKSGTEPQDLYRAIVTGVPGTPMASYGDALIRRRADFSVDDRDAWALVAYIRSLAPPAHMRGLDGLTSGAEIRVQQAPDGEMLLDPSHTAWLNVPGPRLAMRPVWQRMDLQTTINVQAVRNEGEIAISISWDDPTMDLERGPGLFPDGIAVMFAGSEEIPPLPMAVHVEGDTQLPPANIWQWKANRQYAASSELALTGGHPAAGESRWHRFGPPPVEGEAPSGAAPSGELGQDLRLDDTLYMSAIAAANPHADPLLRRFAVLEANAEGFGTLTYQRAEEQGVLGTAVWANGRWFVNMIRPLKSAGENDVDFSRSNRIPVAFAVWDGSKGDRGGNKHISGWHWLVVNPQ